MLGGSESSPESVFQQDRLLKRVGVVDCPDFREEGSAKRKDCKLHHTKCESILVGSVLGILTTS